MRLAWRLAGLAAPILLAACQAATGGEGGVGETRVSSTDEFQSRSGTAIDVDNHPGKALFEQNCLSCHAGAMPKAPAVVWLEMLEPDVVLAAMNEGIMKQQAAHLSPDQRHDIAEYLARIELEDYTPPPPPKQCTGDRLAFTGAPPARVGWGHDASRFVPASVGGVTADNVGDLELKWAFEYPASNRARSQPAVGWNTIFVGSQNGTVYALDLDTGCAKWTYRAGAEVRTAIVVDPDTKRLYFGDVLARAYALDAMTGKLVWRHKVDDHANATITGTPTLGGGMLAVPVSSLEVTSAADPEYDCCTFRGSLVALDPATGKPRWRAWTVPEPGTERGDNGAGGKIIGPSGAPVWGSPTYDAGRNRFYFGSGENYSSPADENSDALFAVDAASGKRLWSVQFTQGDAWNAGCMIGNNSCPEENGPDLDLAASPLLVALSGGKQVIVAGQKSGVAYGVDPDTGKKLWSRRLGHGGTQGGVHFGMAREGTRIYVPITDLVDTHDGRVYDAKLNGSGIHAIDAATGKTLWSRKADNVCKGRNYCDPGISSAATAIPGAVLAGHLDGRLRAYNAADGKVLWEVDTTKEVKTVSGKTARGGSMSGPGPAVYQGRVIANSGYGLYFHMPGNVMLVFGPKD
ncbi:MAG: PQQ-binding-like beta-propeller repeat protein [Sphingomonadaceae bacterium]